MGQEVKNPLRAQSKYGLMGSSAKPGKFLFWGSPEHFLHKNAIWDRTPPPTHQMQSTCVWEGSRVPNLQTEFNYLDSFKSYGIISHFIVPVVPTLSPWSPHHPRVIPVIPTSSPYPPEGPHVVPMAVVSVVSVVSTPCCSRCPCGPHVIPTSSRRSPHHPQSPRYPLHPPYPLGGGSPKSVKMQYDLN